MSVKKLILRGVIKTKMKIQNENYSIPNSERKVSKVEMEQMKSKIKREH